MTARSNGKPKEPINNEEKPPLTGEQLQDLIFNLTLSRSSFMQQFLDPRRDLNKECGYPADPYNVTPDFYRTLYDSEGIARRVVHVLPEECWQSSPEVYEDEDEDTDTEFEKAWKEVCKGIVHDSSYNDEDCSPLWEALRRVDELSGIGRFGVLLMGFDDGRPLSQALAGVDEDSGNMVSVTGFDQDYKSVPVITPGLQGTDLMYQGVEFTPGNPIGSKAKPTKLLFVRAFDESLVQIVRYEANVTSPRFGLPVMYRITFNDPRFQHSGVGLPLATMMVHWSRVIHVADRKSSSEIFGVPRMQPSLHRLLDLAKLYAGSAEMYWKGAFPGLSFETHPQLGGQVKIDADTIRSQMYEYQNDLQRFLLTTGMSAKTLAPSVVDPTSQIQTQLQALCIEIGIPQRIFMGSERGELASSQDAATWDMRVDFRRRKYITPKIICVLVDRLINVGILPKPKDGYKVKWPELDPLTPQEKAQVAFQLTQSLSAYVSGGVEQIMTLQNYLITIVGMDRKQAEQIVDDAMNQEPDDSLTMQEPEPTEEEGQQQEQEQPEEEQ